MVLTLLEAAVEAAEARHHEQVELARSWRSLSTKALGAGRLGAVLGCCAEVLCWGAHGCWAEVLGRRAAGGGRCGGYGRRTNGFFSSLEHQFHAEVSRPSMQLPASKKLSAPG